MSTLATSGFTVETFDAFLATRQEPAWLVDRRRAAWKQFEELPMPSRGDEEWMRTDIRLFHLDRFGFPIDRVIPAETPEALLKHGVDLAGETFACDSRVATAQLDEALARQGVLFGSLDEIARQQGDLVRRHLFSVFDPAYDRFAALHAAAWSGGTFLYVPKGVSIDRPLHTLTTISEGGVDLS